MLKGANDKERDCEKCVQELHKQENDNFGANFAEKIAYAEAPNVPYDAVRTMKQTTYSSFCSNPGGSERRVKSRNALVHSLPDYLCLYTKENNMDSTMDIFT